MRIMVAGATGALGSRLVPRGRPGRTPALDGVLRARRATMATCRRCGWGLVC